MKATMQRRTALSSAADGGGNTIGFHATTSVQTQISQLHALGITYTTINPYTVHDTWNSSSLATIAHII